MCIAKSPYYQHALHAARTQLLAYEYQMYVFKGHFHPSVNSPLPNICFNNSKRSVNLLLPDVCQ